MMHWIPYWGSQLIMVIVRTTEAQPMHLQIVLFDFFPVALERASAVHHAVTFELRLDFFLSQLFLLFIELTVESRKRNVCTHDTNVMMRSPKVLTTVTYTIKM